MINSRDYIHSHAPLHCGCPSNNERWRQDINYIDNSFYLLFFGAIATPEAQYIPLYATEQERWNFLMSLE